MVFRQIFFTLFIGAVLFSSGYAEAIDIEDLRLYGYIDLEYNKANNKEGNREGSFDSWHFNLLFDFPVNHELIVKAQLAFEHGTDTKMDYGEVFVEYAFFEYAFIDELKLLGGRVLTPFGIYNEIIDATPAYLSVDVPRNINSADKRGGFAFFPSVSLL